jgi:hypothetical protein
MHQPTSTAALHYRATNSASMVANQGINSPHAGATNFSAQEVGTSTSLTDPLLVPFPSSLQGPRCYTDASTQPDQSIAVPRDAGIGIFIVDT